MKEPNGEASLNLAFATCTAIYKSYKVYDHCKKKGKAEKEVAPEG